MSKYRFELHLAKYYIMCDNINNKKWVSILIGTIFVGILLTQIKVDDVVLTLSKISPDFFVLGFILYTISYILRSLRFKILLNGKIGFMNLFSIVCVHNMANGILPARTGELSYIYLVKKNGISTGEGIASLMIARVFDIIAVSLLFFISAIAVRQLPTMILNILWIIAGFLVIIIIFLVSFVYRGEKFVGVIERLTERLSLGRLRIISFLLKKAKETTKNFETIKSKRTVLYSFLISILIWYSLYLMVYVLLEAMGLNLTLWVVILGSTFSVISTLLPIQGIGGFGTYECSWALAFMALGISKEAAIASGFAVHIIGFVYFLILGIFGLMATRKRADI